MGWTRFVGIVMIPKGVFHAIAGLSGIIEDGFYAVLPTSVLRFDVTTWGWIHLIGGIVVVVVWARTVRDAISRWSSSHPAARRGGHPTG